MMHSTSTRPSSRWILRIALMLLLTACSSSGPVEPRARLSLSEALGGSGANGFARATAPRPFVFPRDHGSHPEFAAEWWYYTGNLDAGERHFGYQLTFFRFGLTPGEPTRDSKWAASSIYMAHLALADVASGQFYAFERFSRGAAGLAGATGEPFRVWLDDWSAEGSGDGLPMRLRAAQGDIALDLTLEAGKPVVLQGDRGLSQKSAEPGNASYYYSFTRMPSNGTIRAGDTTYQVRGLSWMDREWSTSALGENQTGWDWFALQLSDGRDLMYYQLRTNDGSPDTFSKGVIVAADGTATRIGSADVQLDVLETWISPRSKGNYPSAWHLQIPSAGLDLRITPYLAQQELPVTVIYWEGAVKIEGTANGQAVSGNGYVELTGYVNQPESSPRAVPGASNLPIHEPE